LAVEAIDVRGRPLLASVVRRLQVSRMKCSPREDVEC